MDLQLYSRILWRFKYLVLGGLVLAAALAVLSFVRIGGSPFLQYRQDESWVSYAKVFVTKEGFNLGRLGGNTADKSATDLADLTTQAILYSQLADSDPVRALMLEDGPIDGTIEVAPVAASASSDEALPIISIAGIAATQEQAISLASRQANALRDFLEQEQTNEYVPPAQRVHLDVVKEPRQAQLLSGRGMTLPMVVFLTVMIAVIGLAFILENLHPRGASESDGSRMEPHVAGSKTAA